MWLSLQSRVLWLSVFFLTLTEGAVLRSTDGCAQGEYWCQDRCGSDAYGDTCCQTPNGRHNLCGIGTICCMYGCCPSGTICNAVGGCDNPNSIPQPSNNASVSEPVTGSGQCTSASFITSQTIITERHTITDFVTLSFHEACSSVGTSSSPGGPPESSSAFSSSSTLPGGSETSFSQGTGTETGTGTNPGTSTLPGGSGTSFSQGSGSRTGTGTNPSTLTLLGGSGTSFSQGTGTGTGTSTNPGTSTLPGGSRTGSPSSGLSTFTEPDGQTVISSSGVIIIGTDLITLPSVSSLSTLTTDGETFTLLPTSTGGSATSGPLTTTLPDGNTIVSNSGVIVIGTNSITLPIVTSPTTLITDKETFTLLPLITAPTTTVPTLGPITTTLPDGQRVISSSGIIIIGTDTFTAPTGLTTPVTVTTDGETFTFQPLPTQPVSDTTSSTTNIVPLTTFTSWPPGAQIIPVTTSVDNPQQTDGGSVTTCKLWFFFICIQTNDIHIGGWIWKLPPGIYLPGPPPPDVIKLPPSINIQGMLPPWPKFTVGPDSIPTYPSEPENNQCETETASLCATTTSIGASTTNVGATCATIMGCDVQNSATTFATSCSPSTVTDYWVSCLSSSCMTTSTSIITGCSVTASVTTTTAAPTGPFCELGESLPDVPITTTEACTGCSTVSNIIIATSVPTGLTSVNVMNDIDPQQEATALDERVAALIPRAAQPMPLLLPDNFGRTRNRQVDFVRALLGQVPNDSDNNIPIVPPDRQLSTWTVNGIPIGVTGLWYEFGNDPQVWKMQGLHGCTAVFIVSQNGFWAGHLWESSKPDRINSGSSFLKRVSVDSVELRTDDEFKSIAVDILTQDTPADQVNNREFTSLTDLKNNKGNPLANSQDVDAFVLTRANSRQDPSQRYGSKITLLRMGLTGAIPGSTYKDLTYVPYDSGATIPTDVSGVITVQYTPFQGLGEDGCTPYAAVRVWAEVNAEPVIEKEWATLSNQQMNQRKRQACAFPSSTTTTTPITSPPSTTTTTTTTAPFPTLPSATSPKDSTCLSTATITSCQIGPDPGHPGTVCVTQTSCADWEPTSKTVVPPSTTTTPLSTTMTPLAVGAKMCFPESKFPNHGDIDPDLQSQYIGLECTGSANENIGPDSDPIIFDTITNGTPYYYSISWIKGCRTSVAHQNAWQPIGDNGDVTCFSLLGGDYSNCANGGAGGWAEAGCLRYIFEPCDPKTSTCGL